MKFILLAQLASTWFMVGLIWFVQIVHYPLFARVGADFALYENEHTRWTAWVVGPMMCIELASAIWLSAAPSLNAARPWTMAGLCLLIVIWVSTICLQVPRHAELMTGFSVESHRFLVISNWVRTVSWSARGLIVLLIFEQGVRSNLTAN